MSFKRSLKLIGCGKINVVIFLFLITVFYVCYFNNIIDFLKRETKVVKVDGLRKLDYHDAEYQKLESNQKGFGEKGMSAKLAESLNTEKEDLYKVNGFNGRLSDEIALNRSVADIRHAKCKDRLYSADLSTTSVIVPFHEEHWSTLLRTAFSAYNRAPKHLLLEILLIDDASSKDFLGEKLDSYLREHLPIARVIRLPERRGLIRARLAGAEQAKGEVFVFLDSHTECNTNWLPPLLDPIAMDYRTATCPFIDVVDFDTFEYRAQDEGRRGAFDWEFFYKRLPLLKKDLDNMPEPFKSPVMAGGLFAISARFFWELGGYDPGLDIWGGEQYELSFKIWQCHGRMLDVPCSRVGHIYRKFAPFPNPRSDDFLARNYRRVAEVWMDEYKKYLYMRQPNWLTVETGNLSAQRAVRERNQCRSFDWFMREVAFDLTKHYPLIDPPDYANGTITSVASTSLCVDARQKDQFDRIDRVAHCNGDASQQFQLTAYKDLRPIKSTNCFDVPDVGEGSHAPVLLFGCHKGLGNQMWKYNLKTKQLMFSPSYSHCLDVSPRSKEVFVSTCDTFSLNQRWIFERINRERLAQYDHADPLPENVYD